MRLFPKFPVFLFTIQLVSSLFMMAITGFQVPEFRDRVLRFHSTKKWTTTTELTSRKTTRLSISFGGLGGGDKKNSYNNESNTSLPRDVKDAVAKCRAATQEALKNRCSRMDIEFPVGTKFGVEKTPKTTASSLADSKSGAATQSVLDQSDRELARLFVEMFQPVGGEHIVVAFKDQTLADQAKQQWKGDYGASSRILAMNRRKVDKSNKKKSIKPKGFAAKLAAELDDNDDGGVNSSGLFQLPDGTEVALFVSPGPRELVVVEKICNQVGMGTLVVLLNSRLSKIANFGTSSAAKLFKEDFEPVFCLSAAAQDVAPDCLLYRAYPGSWVMARKPKVGQPKPILVQASKPTRDQCQEAYNGLELSDIEKGVESALENVAGWFR